MQSGCIDVHVRGTKDFYKQQSRRTVKVHLNEKKESQMKVAVINWEVSPQT